MLIPFTVIGLFPDAQAQIVTANVTGDPFTIGEGSKTLILYQAASNIVDTDDSIIQQFIFLPTNYNVDSSERLIINFTSFGTIQRLVIDLDTTLGELQQTIGSGSPLPTGSGMFNYNVTSLTTQDGITNIYLAVFDDDVITNSRIGAGTAVPLIEDAISERSVTTHLDTVPVSPSYDPLYNSTLADKNIGYIIEFNSPVSVISGSYPISLDFNTFESDGTPINQITRQSVELTPAQQITYQNLVNAIAARQTAIDQQNVIVDYWSDSNNPFADDRELAQSRIDYANSHITQSTTQLNSYQAQLDQILNP